MDDAESAASDRDVQRFLAQLAGADEPQAFAAAHLGDLRARPPRFQIELLHACVRAMPELRARGERALGSAHFQLAGALYRARLPFTEEDVCRLLRASKHDCGHGEDVAPPLELALALARKHGVSAPLLAAVAEYAAALDGLRATTASNARRKARVLLLLDPARAAAAPCWSDRFRAGLAAMAPEERRRWEWLVAQIHVNDQSGCAEGWRKVARRFAEDLGREKVLTRLEEWLPKPEESPRVALSTEGSHLLKSLAWVVETLAAETPDPRCDALVERLTRVEWKHPEKAAKVLAAAVHYFREGEGALASAALERLAATPTEDDSSLAAALGRRSLAATSQPAPPATALSSLGERLRRLFRRRG